MTVSKKQLVFHFVFVLLSWSATVYRFKGGEFEHAIIGAGITVLLMYTFQKRWDKYHEAKK